ncbi:MAG: hypothetical protein BVN31_07475 [Proteobacteria bacterium ST_bin15]|nr:MAG: hypothetical protein BVN31_07475 [Proteobacteria bacterium ST_bin15]
MIAGGGPVGLTAAVELYRRGFQPRVIDPDLTAVIMGKSLLAQRFRWLMSLVLNMTVFQRSMSPGLMGLTSPNLPK